MPAAMTTLPRHGRARDLARAREGIASEFSTPQSSVDDTLRGQLWNSSRAPLDQIGDNTA